VRGEVSWRDVNLFDRAWELSSGLRLEQLRQSLYADVFLPPDPDGRRFSVGGAVERSDIEGLTVETQAVGVARTNTHGNIETRIALRVQQEMRQPAGAEASTRIATTLNWTWTRRHVDDVLDPRQGDVLQFQVGGGSRLLLSDRDFLRLYGRQVFYRTVSPNNVLILRAEGGITLAEERDGVPQDFLFRTGGTQTVRGYAFQSLGVKEGDAIVGGRYLGVASAEYVHWFSPQWGGATFVDAGDAADDRKGLAVKVGYGVGARWKSPAGPIALDVAYGQQERRVRLHFGVAIAF
jgi:translocation and assembly module TamA